MTSPYRLSSVQQGMLFSGRTNPKTGTDIEQILIHAPFALDEVALEQAWIAAVAAYPTLRTRFLWEGSEPMQCEEETAAVPMAIVDWSSMESEERDARFAQHVRDDRERGFDLSAVPLTRLALFRFSGNDNRLLWTFHHIVLDGRAFTLILRSVFRAYESLRRGETAKIPLARSYREYIEWIETVDRTGAEEFWAERLRGITSPTPLPYDRLPSGSTEGSRYGESEHRLSVELSERVRGFVAEYQITSNTLFMGVWAILLSRYSGEKEVVFGASKTTRRGTLPGAEEMVGLFLNTLPVRVSLSDDPFARDFLTRVRSDWLSLRAFEHASLPDIRQATEIPSRAPMFNSLVVFENTHFGTELQETEPACRSFRFELREQTNFDLSFLIYGDPAILLKLEFDARRFEPVTVQRMFGHITSLLESIVDNPAQPVSKLNMLPEAERALVIRTWNATRIDYPRDRCFFELFEEQANRTPDREAVRFEERALSYKELNERANQIARLLEERGAGPGKIVALCMNRSEQMLAALLGIAKSGAAYLPMDPEFPAERLRFMLDDARPVALLTETQLAGRFADAASIIDFDAEREEIGDRSKNDLPARAAPGDLAYILYTSGSTGKPKGVEIGHRALVNFLCAMLRAPGLSEGDTLLAVTTISFDIAGLELYAPLLCGACVVIAGKPTASDGYALQIALTRQKISVMQATPATWQMLLNAGWEGCRDLKVLCGGEAMGRDLAAHLLTRTSSLWNMYGPTETTIWSTVHLVTSPEISIPIGRPIANTTIYILDERGTPAPVGVIGELYIGGDGLAHGYRGRPELTAERFVPDPFDHSGDARIYRTGDLARYRADGLIECLGRVDHQVKIRGFRIELGEIETTLEQHPSVAKAVVAAAESDTGKALVAYLVPRAGSKPQIPELRTQVSDLLPSYMTPAHYVVLEAIPLTPNGKVDRRALPPVNNTGASEEQQYVAPRNAVERQLCQIWAEVLKRDRIGIRENFFELGGHSLLAVQLYAKLMLSNIPLSTLLENPTIEKFAEAVARPEFHQFRCLLPMRVSGKRAPFFCVHGAGGNVLSLRNLAYNLSSDQPFYSLQARGLDGAEYDYSVEDTAAHYVTEIRSVQPHGPYFLGGGSFGGLVAFEMARQLREQGEEIGVLALFDTFNYGFGRQIPKHQLFYCYARYGIKRAFYHLRRMQELTWTERRARLGDRFIARRVNSRRVESEFQQTLDRVRAANMAAGYRFVPKPFDRPIALFRAETRMPEPFEDPLLGWGPVARAGVLVIDIPGDHESHGVDPHILTFARKLDRLLEDSQPKASFQRPEPSTFAA